MIELAYNSLDGRETDAVKRRKRVSEACINCRARKTKCDAALPTCSFCLNSNIPCSYTSGVGDGKSTGDFYFKSLEERFQRLEEQLRSRLVPSPDSNAVMSHEVSSVTDTNVCVTGDTTVANNVKSPEADLGNTTEKEPSHTTCSVTISPDIENYNQSDTTEMDAMVSLPVPKNGRYYGSSSNISLIEEILASIIPTYPSHLVKDVLSHGMPHDHEPASPSVDLLPRALEFDILLMPPESAAQNYFDLYFTNTHYLYPFINEDEFRKTYQIFTHEGVSSARPTWLAMMNLIIALAIITRNDEKKTIDEKVQESRVFVQRAWYNVGSDVLGGKSLEFVQVLLLKSMYLQSTSHSNHCWNVTGLAIRMAQSLGLHESSTYSDDSSTAAEFKKRAWCMCTLLDRNMSMTFGRPLCLNADLVSLELPTEVKGEVWFYDRNGRKFPLVALFAASTALAKIIGEALEALYGKRFDQRGNQPDGDVPRKVQTVLQLESDLEKWRLVLPAAMRPEKCTTDASSTGSTLPLTRYQTILTLRYHNLRILIHRTLLLPALSHALYHPDSTDYEADHDFSQRVADFSSEICIRSAMTTVWTAQNALNVSPEGKLLGAWWFLLFYCRLPLMLLLKLIILVFNALLVIFANLFILLSQPASHQKPPSGISVAQQTLAFEQGFRLIRKMATGSHSADRCYQFLRKLMETLHSQTKQSDVVDESQIAIPAPFRETRVEQAVSAPGFSTNNGDAMQSPAGSGQSRVIQTEENFDSWGYLLNQSNPILKVADFETWSWLLDNQADFVT